MSRIEEIAWWLAGATCMAMLLYPPWHRHVGSSGGQICEFCYNWILWDQSATSGAEPFHVHLGLLIVQWIVVLATPVLIGMFCRRILRSRPCQGK